MCIDQIVPAKLGHTKEPGNCRCRFPAPQSRKIFQRDISTDVERENPRILSDIFDCLVLQSLREFIQFTSVIVNLSIFLVDPSTFSLYF